MERSSSPESVDTDCTPPPILPWGLGEILQNSSYSFMPTTPTSSEDESSSAEASPPRLEYHSPPRANQKALPRFPTPERKNATQRSQPRFPSNGRRSNSGSPTKRWNRNNATNNRAGKKPPRRRRWANNDTQAEDERPSSRFNRRRSQRGSSKNESDRSPSSRSRKWRPTRPRREWRPANRNSQSSDSQQESSSSPDRSHPPQPPAIPQQSVKSKRPPKRELMRVYPRPRTIPSYNETRSMEFEVGVHYLSQQSCEAPLSDDLKTPDERVIAKMVSKRDPNRRAKPALVVAIPPRRVVRRRPPTTPEWDASDEDEPEGVSQDWSLNPPVHRVGEDVPHSRLDLYDVKRQDSTDEYHPLRLPTQIWVWQVFQYLRGRDIFVLRSVHRRLNPIRMMRRNSVVLRYLIDRDFPFVWDQCPVDLDTQLRPWLYTDTSNGTWMQLYFDKTNLLRTYLELSRAQHHPYFQYFGRNPRQIPEVDQIENFCNNLERACLGEAMQDSCDIPFYVFFHPNLDHWSHMASARLSQNDMHSNHTFHKMEKGSCCYFTTGMALHNFNDITETDIMITIDDQTNMRLPLMVKKFAVNANFCFRPLQPGKKEWLHFKKYDRVRYETFCNMYKREYWVVNSSQKKFFTGRSKRLIASQSKRHLARRMEQNLKRLAWFICGVCEHSDHAAGVWDEFLNERRRMVRLGDVPNFVEGPDRRDFVRAGPLEYGFFDEV